MNQETVLKAVRAGFGVLERVAPEAGARLALWLFMRPRRHPRPEREREVLGGAEALRLAGLSAHAWGPQDGPTVLLLHGWEGRGTQMAAFVEPLVAAGRRVVALDGPAHGDSPGNATHLPGFSEAVGAAARALGPLEAVVAHSFGVAVTAYALDHGMEAGRVVLIGGPARIGGVFSRYGEMVGLGPRILQRFHRRIVEMVGRTADSMGIDAIGPRLRVPALVIHDVEDAEVPYEEARVIERHWPGARLLTVRGHGHRRILRAGDVVRDVVAFVTGAEADSEAAEEGSREERSRNRSASAAVGGLSRAQA